MAAIYVFFHLLILLAIFTVCRSQYSKDNVRCMYSMYVGTGSMVKAGTNSTITLELWDETGFGIRIVDLVRDGGFLSKDQYDYFEPGSIDMFSLTGPCLRAPLCAINFTSDGTGPNDETGNALAQGWYCEFLEITTIGFGQPSLKRTFAVLEWLAPHPYRLSAVKNFCGGKESNNLPSKLSKIVPV